MSNHTQVNLTPRNLLLNGQPFLLFGAEIQYFRLNADEWESRLRSAVEGGVNTVSSYMPWFWHEPEEGKFDLTGSSNPARNLRRFLDLISESGMKLVARPGPFVNAELRCGGIPEWLFRNYPETMSRRSDGQVVPGRPVPAEGGRTYRSYVRKWYETIVPLIAEYGASRGGPLILFQPDNEISAAWSFGLLNSLYDPEIIEEFWPRWLEQNYNGCLDTLSKAHGVTHTDFAVPPPRSFPSCPGERSLCLDWMNFKRSFFADWGATLAGWAAELGITVPVLFNEPVAGYYGHGDHSGFGAELRKRGITGLTACHTYSDRILDLDGLTNLCLGVELTKSSPWGGPPMSMELNTDWFIPRLARSEINFDTLLRVGLGRGLKGFVPYVYAAATTSHSDSIAGRGYYSNSCLARDGQRNWNWRAFRRFARFAAGWKNELLSGTASPAVLLAFTPGQRQQDFLGTNRSLTDSSGEDTLSSVPGGLAFDSEPVLAKAAGSMGHDWLDGYEGVSKQTVRAESGVWHRTREAIVMLNRLNKPWAMLDLVNPNRSPGQGLIIVPCVGTLESQAIDFLMQHLDAGGSCLFFPTLPFFNLEGQADNRIAERLGVSFRKLVRPAGGRPLDYGARQVDCPDGLSLTVNGWLWLHNLPESCQPLANFENDTLVTQLPPERGRAILAGLDMQYVTAETLALWDDILAAAGAPPADCQIEGNWLYALKLDSGESSFLTLHNVTGRHGRSLVTCNLADGDQVQFEIELLPNSSRCLVMNVPLPDGGKLLYSTSELTPMPSRRTAWLAAGCCGTWGEMVFDRPLLLSIDGNKLKTREVEGRHTARYRHSSEPLEIII